jgi:hypothetical protein
MPTRSVSSVLCAVCNNPVPLETAGTDQDGNAVHRDCYIKKLTATKKVSKNEQTRK